MRTHAQTHTHRAHLLCPQNFRGVIGSRPSNGRRMSSASIPHPSYSEVASSPPAASCLLRPPAAPEPGRSAHSDARLGAVVSPGWCTPSLTSGRQGPSRGPLSFPTRTLAENDPRLRAWRL